MNEQPIIKKSPTGPTRRSRIFLPGTQPFCKIENLLKFVFSFLEVIKQTKATMKLTKFSRLIKRKNKKNKKKNDTSSSPSNTTTVEEIKVAPKKTVRISVETEMSVVHDDHNEEKDACTWEELLHERTMSTKGTATAPPKHDDNSTMLSPLPPPPPPPAPQSRKATKESKRGRGRLFQWTNHRSSAAVNPPKDIEYGPSLMDAVPDEETLTYYTGTGGTGFDDDSTCVSGVTSLTGRSVATGRSVMTMGRRTLCLTDFVCNAVTTDDALGLADTIGYGYDALSDAVSKFRKAGNGSDYYHTTTKEGYEMELNGNGNGDIVGGGAELGIMIVDTASFNEESVKLYEETKEEEDVMYDYNEQAPMVRPLRISKITDHPHFQNRQKVEEQKEETKEDYYSNTPEEAAAPIMIRV